MRGRAIDRGEVDIGTQQSQAIPPGLFWRFHMTVHHPTYIKFNLSLSHNALLGVYGRRNIPPTHTQVKTAPVVACCSSRWACLLQLPQITSKLMNLFFLCFGLSSTQRQWLWLHFKCPLGMYVYICASTPILSLGILNTQKYFLSI